MRRKLIRAAERTVPLDRQSEFMADVRAGLCRVGQKQLPPKYFYDELGSVLFDAITLLPEYGLTRADTRLLTEHARDVAALKHFSVVAELGSGSGLKTRHVLQAIALDSNVTYYPIDISASALRRCEQEIGSIQGVEVTPIEDSYLNGLRRLRRLRKPRSAVLILFLGSSIGNLTPAETDDLCRSVRREMQRGDVFFISTDLRKDVDRMILAYDDPVGVTAAFNLNVLARMNRELSADIDLARFEHEARYNVSEGRIEMHLRSTIDQIVNFGSEFSVTFRRNETIWTESSYKYELSHIRELASRTGFRCDIQWVDEEWPFAQSVFVAG